MSTQGPPADAKTAQAAALLEMETAQRRKRALEMNLANIEAQIAATEAAYLDDTHATGNVLKGFENYLKPPGTHHGRRRADAEEERLFSGSSVKLQPVEHR